jgi:hypothetical protein
MGNSELGIEDYNRAIELEPNTMMLLQITIL